MHAHCEGRKLQQILEFAESRGVNVDDFCTEKRVWEPGQFSKDGRPKVILPGPGRPDSEFANEIGVVVSPKHQWFNYGEQVVILRVVSLGEDYEYFGFHPLQPVEAGTNLEQFVQTGRLKRDHDDVVFEPNSLRREGASYLLSAPQLIRKLPKVLRILDTPIPILRNERVVYPQLGYNPDLQVYTNPNSPPLSKMNYEDTVGLIDELFSDFCFADEQAKTNAIAKLLTPFCKGLIGWGSKVPFWLFGANRERIGKDYLCELIQIVHEGRASSHPAFESDEELRKKITSALRSGARRMHFGNMRGHVNSKALEQAITAKYWEDRILGVNENRIFPNEIEFSMSANVGASWPADLDLRMVKITLFLPGENPNARQFKHADLHKWAKEHRGDILSLLAAMVHRWENAGRPDGPSSFASFPEWAKVIGGIMLACNLGDPCIPIDRDNEDGGDEMTLDIKTLFRLANEAFGTDWITKQQIYELVDQEEVDLFSWMNLSERRGQTTLGRALSRFNKRDLGGVVLKIKGGKNSRRYQFSNMDDPGLTTVSSTEGTSGTSNGADSAPPSPAVDESLNSQNIKQGTSGTSNETDSVVMPSKSSFPHSKQGTSGTLGTYSLPRRESPKESSGVSICVDKTQYKKGGHYVPEIPDVPSPPKYRFLADKTVLGQIVGTIQRSRAAVALDIETYGDGLNPWRGDIRLLSLAVPDHPAWLLDLRAIGYDLGELGECLQQHQVIAHNAKFDLLWLRHKCGLKFDNIFCTLTASRLLSNGKRELRNDLYTCWERFLGLPPGNDQGKSDWSDLILTEEQKAYAALDVLHLHRLKDKQSEAIAAEQLERVFELENQLIPVVVEMENRGFKINRDRLVEIMEDYSAELTEAGREIGDELGQQVNLNSPKQLKEILATKGLTLPNTSVQTLTESGHHLADGILNYRSAKKQMEQTETILKAIETDGRIHARFEPTGTNTGRFSSKKPNLQNIGRGKLRTCFIPDKGHRLVVADYSQVELRIAAAIAGEEKMIQAYAQGSDLHRQTASIVLGKSVEDISKEDRQLAKAVNFGLLYGQSAKGLVRYAKTSYGVKLETEQARQIRRKFFDEYKHLREWHNQANEDAGSNREVLSTQLGRKRWLPMEGDVQWQRFTALLNAPVQGGAADVIKTAITGLQAKLPEGAGMVSTVHDELIVEVPLKDAETVKKLVEGVMLESAASLYPTVTFEVEAHICEDWSEK
jgi:DNA polymerase I-like protein with 3'-5' exonuclease and polymerase domains